MSAGLLRMSLSGGAVILVLAALRALALHRLPKRFFAAMWWLPLIRLLVPFSIPAAFSVYSLLERQSPKVPEAVPYAVPAVTISDTLVTETSAVQGGGPPPDVLPIIWLAGMLCCALFFGAVYFSCRRRFREALPVSCPYVGLWLSGHRLRRPVEVRQSDRISAPLTYGIFRPVILLPASTDWEDLETLNWVLTHEWVHIRRFDSGLKLLYTAAVCVHWFNPLVWLMSALAGRDMELACDEAVLRLSGAGRRAGYARALIRMEEQKSGLLLTGSHFSKNPIEERIRAIMKIQKNSLAAMLAAVVLVGVATAFLATSAKAEDTNSGAPQTAYTAQSDDSIMSYTSADGTTYYSFNEGVTWQAMTDEEFAEAFPDPNVEWWTAEGYAEWLENEKENLKDIVGSQGWTPSTGWFTWTQEMVAETIAQYEETLALIQNGYLVSKSVDGSEDTMMVMNPADIAANDGSYDAVAEAAEKSPESADADLDTLLEIYKTLGLEYRFKDSSMLFFDNGGSLYWNGRRVRIFVDGVEHEGGFFTRYDHYDPEGVVDLHTVRERVDNGDGSFDPMGKLVRIEEFEPEQMFLDALDCQRQLNEMQAENKARTAGELAPYSRFGLAYSFDSNQESGPLRMTWNGQPVRSLFDPERQLWVANSLGAEGLDIEAVYDGSRLTGLRVSEADKELVEAGAVLGDASTAYGNGGSGETVAGRMKKYEPYGVGCKESDGGVKLSYNGRAVKSFADVRPDGSVFSVESTGGGTVSLVTEYGRDGRLSGVREVN